MTGHLPRLDICRRTCWTRLAFTHRRLSDVQTPSDSPWTESADIKVDESSVLGYDALTRLEDWAANDAPLMFDFDFDQASLFSGSLPIAYNYISCR